MRQSGNILPLLLAAVIFGIAMLVMQLAERAPRGNMPERDAARPKAGGAQTADRSANIAGSGAVGASRTGSGVREPPREPLAVVPGAGQSYVISLPPEGNLDAVAGLARSLGIVVLGSHPVLRALEVQATAGQMARLREAADTQLRTEENALVYVPYVGQEPVQGMVSGQPFGMDALSSIGVNQVGSDWGQGTTVAVLDNGILPHPALDQAMIMTWDLVNEQQPAAGPFAGHGTAVASLLAGDGVGVQGISPASDILSIKVVDSFGVGDAFSLASGIVLAVDSGASVINISLGTDRPSQVLADAVRYARDHGVAIVAAAGNDGGDILYPAAFEGVMAVGAVDATGAKEAYSNVGESLDIMAPGTGVVAAWSAGENVWMTGTSAAAPFVAGALAVLLASQPASTPAEALDALLDTTNDTGAPGADPEYGEGLLDLRRALRRDEPGHVDAALADHYLPWTEPADGQIGVIVTAQNRGTEVIGAMTVVTEFAGHRLERRFVTVQPGETVSMPVGIAADLVSPTDGLLLRSRVVLDGGDGNPGNDTRTSRINVATVP